jgi:hypothetical protein
MCPLILNTFILFANQKTTAERESLFQLRGAIPLVNQVIKDKVSKVSIFVYHLRKFVEG